MGLEEREITLKLAIADRFPKFYQTAKEIKRHVEATIDKYPKRVVKKVGGVSFKMLVHTKREKGEVKGKYFEKDVIELVLKCLQAGDVFMDIGSSTGTHALPAAKKCGESGSVIAVDPDDETLSALKYNIQLNKLNNVTVLKVAISDKDGTLMLKGDGLKGGAPRIVSDKTSAFEGREVQVETRSIESLVNNAEIRVPNVVKIDVEGHGKKVILGLGKVRPKHIFMEIHPTLGEDEIEITRLLNEMGYKSVGKPVKRFNEFHVHFELNFNN